MSGDRSGRVSVVCGRLKKKTKSCRNCANSMLQGQAQKNISTLRNRYGIGVARSGRLESATESAQADRARVQQGQRKFEPTKKRGSSRDARNTRMKSEDGGQSFAERA